MRGESDSNIYFKDIYPTLTQFCEKVISLFLLMLDMGMDIYYAKVCKTLVIFCVYVFSAHSCHVERLVTDIEVRLIIVSSC